MKRRFIPMSKLDIFDEFHYQSGDSFEVNVALDGNTTEYHKEGINRIKGAIEKGCKVLPILVVQEGDRYKLLDGFKRSYAHKELGIKHIEAFVCTQEETHRQETYSFQNHHIRCWKGGLPFEHFGLFEGAENDDQNYETTQFLYKSPKGNGLRIEASECIHIHWGDFGRYRLSLGRRDFRTLAEAISSIK